MTKDELADFIRSYSVKHVWITRFCSNRKEKEMKVVIVLTCVLLLLVACGPVPENVVVEDAKRIVWMTRLTSTTNRVIDVEAGVVCYIGMRWGQCFLLSETRLDY